VDLFLEVVIDAEALQVVDGGHQTSRSGYSKGIL
jgi:hypothetical protein